MICGSHIIIIRGPCFVMFQGELISNWKVFDFGVLVGVEGFSGFWFVMNYFLMV